MVAYPVGLRTLERRIGQSAAAVHFPVLHGQEGLLGPRITGHELELGAEHGIEHHRKGVGLRSRAGAGDRHLLLHRILDRVERTAVPGDADADVATDRADPLEFAHVVAGIARADQRLGQRAAGKGGDGGAVFRRRHGEEIRGANAACARHVLHVDHRVALDVGADMPAEQARIEIEPAARRARDIDADRLGDGIRRLRLRRRGAEQGERSHGQAELRARHPIATRRGAHRTLHPNHGKTPFGGGRRPPSDRARADAPPLATIMAQWRNNDKAHEHAGTTHVPCETIVAVANALLIGVARARSSLRR